MQPTSFLHSANLFTVVMHRRNIKMAAVSRLGCVKLGLSFKNVTDM